jgi:16S rRNA G1207 methylase RsmC
MNMKNQTEIKFSLGPDKELELAFAPGVFAPNTTTTLLIQAVKNTISNPATLLDLGCGTGVVGLALNFEGLIQSPLYASDLSKNAVLCSRVNFERYDCPAEVRDGSLFGPWQGKKFDVIVDDISGISQSVADVSPWFQGVPCDTGEDGIDLVVEIIRKAPQHLNQDGRFFFPVLSLSNVEKLLQVARENFGTVERVGRQDWPLPAELKAHLPLLRKLKAEGSIKLEEKFGMVLCYTEAYCATNPIY